MAGEDNKGQQNGNPGATMSDAPTDLAQEREVLVRQFLKKGLELTEGLLDENREIRQELDRLREELTVLRTHVEGDEAKSGLLVQIERLRDERNELLSRSSKLEESTRQFEERNGEIEKELHDLANLYIASSHLHSTLSPKGVVKNLRELLQQLVGAERFVIYLLDEGGETASPLVADGLEDAPPPLVAGEQIAGRALETGLLFIADDNPVQDGSIESPIAVIPLISEGECVGVITVIKFFEQKNRWATVDHELFRLLGSHATNALIAANQCLHATNPRKALEGIANNISAAN